MMVVTPAGGTVIGSGRVVGRVTLLPLSGDASDEAKALHAALSRSDPQDTSTPTCR